MKIIPLNEFNVWIPIMMSEVHVLIRDLLVLFCWFSLILFTYRVLCYFYIHPGSTKVKLWHIRQKNFKRLATAEKHVSYHLLDANIYSSYFVCLLLNWGIFLPQISSPAANLFPLDLPSEPWREVVGLMYLSFRRYLSFQHTHFIHLLAKGNSLKLL